MRLSWNGPDDWRDGKFEIYRTSGDVINGDDVINGGDVTNGDEEQFELVRTVSGNIASVVIKKLKERTRYKFRVASLSAKGDRQFSADSDWASTEGKGKEMNVLSFYHYYYLV